MTNVHFPGLEIDLVGFHSPLLWEQRTAQRGGKHQAAKRREAQRSNITTSGCLHKIHSVDGSYFIFPRQICSYGDCKLKRRAVSFVNWSKCGIVMLVVRSQQFLQARGRTRSCLVDHQILIKVNYRALESTHNG